MMILSQKNKCNMIYNLQYLNFCSKVDRVNYMCHVWVIWLWINIRKAFLPNRWNKWKNHENNWCLDKKSQVSCERKNFLRAHAIGNHCKGCSWQTVSYMSICFWLGKKGECWPFSLCHKFASFPCKPLASFHVKTIIHCTLLALNIMRIKFLLMNTAPVGLHHE